MIKYYCDICGDEITDQNAKPLELTGEVTSMTDMPKKKLTVQLTEVDPCGDMEARVCKYCMLDAISSADDRPKAS